MKGNAALPPGQFHSYLSSSPCTRDAIDKIGPALLTLNSMFWYFSLSVCSSSLSDDS